MFTKKRGVRGSSSSSCRFLLGCHYNRVSFGGGAMSIRRHPIRSRCSRRWEDHSRQVGQRERKRRGGGRLSISTLVMFRMICQLFYKLFPCLLSFFFYFFILRVSSLCSTRTNPDKAQSLTLYSLPQLPR